MTRKPLLRTYVATMALVLLGASAASAGPLFSWSWNAGDAGDVSNNAGVINWVDATFDSNTRELTWTANFGAVPGLPGAQTMGFALALTSGGAPSERGDSAVLYYDGSRTEPVLTGYGYNGEGFNSSLVGWLGRRRMPGAGFDRLLPGQARFDLGA